MSEEMKVVETEESVNENENRFGNVELTKEGKGLLGVGAAALVGVGMFVGKKLADRKAKKAAASAEGEPKTTLKQRIADKLPFEMKKKPVATDQTSGDNNTPKES